MTAEMGSEEGVKHGKAQNTVDGSGAVKRDMFSVFRMLRDTRWEETAWSARCKHMFSKALQERRTGENR